MLRWLSLAALVIVADQLTKWLAVAKLSVRTVTVVPGFFDLVLVRNTGAAFGFLNDAGGWQNVFFVGVAALVSTVLVIMLRRLRPGDRVAAWALSLILGGALGNLIDRLRLGYVIDFVDWYYGRWHWPAFNVADAAITVGAALLVLDALANGRSLDRPGRGNGDRGRR
jgi:signal peptidase II